MARPQNDKIVEKDPIYTCYRPVGVPKSALKRVEVSAQEFEAIRLFNLEWLSNVDWAERMNTSAPTFNRLVKSAHQKITDAIVNWMWIRIYKQDWTHNCD